MEIPTPFDLNDAIQRWRENLATSPAFRAENLNELEAHLRDSVSALAAKGLSEEEAWWVAMRRMGESASLRQEYGKLNDREVWMDRILWMVAGYLLIGWCTMIASTFSNLAVAAGSMVHASPHQRGVMMTIAYPAALLGVMILAWRLSARLQGTSARIGAWCRIHPVYVGFGVMVMAVCFSFARGAAHGLALNSMPLGDRTMFVGYYSFIVLPFALLWPGMLAWLLWRRSRTNENAG